MIAFTGFHPDWKMQNKVPTPAETLLNARRIAQGNGVRYTYTGNINDNIGGTTFCSECDRKLITRNWYSLSDWNLDELGRCSYCKHPCKGHFEPQPGSWGTQRRPVRLSDFSTH